MSKLHAVLNTLKGDMVVGLPCVIGLEFPIDQLGSISGYRRGVSLMTSVQPH